MFKRLIVAAFIAFATPVMITACSNNGTVQEAPDFDEVLGQAFLTVEVVSDMVSDAVIRDRISLDRAEKLEQQLTNIVDELLRIKALGESVDGMDRLKQLEAILREIEKGIVE